MSTTSMSLADLRAMPHISISQLKTYVQCPKKYFLQYIERSEPSHRASALAFGTAFHQTIGEHLLPQVEGQYLTRDELRAVFRDTLTEEVNGEGPPVLFEDDENLAKSIALGHLMLDEFFLRVPRPDKVLDVELPFILELAHPVTGEIAPVPFIGALDALVIDEGRTAVWELKTGKKKWSQDMLEWDPQMTGYSMAASALGHDDAELKLLVTTKTKAPDVQVERLVRHRADKQELAETALTVLQAVNAGVDYRVRGWGCKTCAHAGVCGV